MRAGVGGVAATAPARAASAGFPPYRVGNEGQGAGAGAGGAPEGHLLPPRPLLEDVSGKAHVLPAGAEQDYLGGARALPEPVPCGLRRLWLRVVSVTGPGVVVASWSFMPQSRACAHGSAMHQAAGIFSGGGLAAPSTLCSTPCAPCTPHPAHLGGWSAVCGMQVHGGRRVVVVVPELSPGSHPAHSLPGGCCSGQARGSPCWRRAEGLCREVRPSWAPEPAL